MNRSMLSRFPGRTGALAGIALLCLSTAVLAAGRCSMH